MGPAPCENPLINRSPNRLLNQLPNRLLFSTPTIGNNPYNADCGHIQRANCSLNRLPNRLPNCSLFGRIGFLYLFLSWTITLYLSYPLVPHKQPDARHG